MSIILFIFYKKNNKLHANNHKNMVFAKDSFCESRKLHFEPFIFNLLISDAKRSRILKRAKNSSEEPKMTENDFLRTPRTLRTQKDLI